VVQTKLDENGIVLSICHSFPNLGSRQNSY